MSGTAVVFGARNLGGAIIQHLLERGWDVTGVARSEDTLEKVRAWGATAASADAGDAAEVKRVLEGAGSPTLLVNAVSAARPTREGPFGGGQLAEAEVEDFRGWTAAVAEQAFVFLSEGARALRASGGGTLIQVTGGSSRRAMPGRGLWSAGAQATRALVHAAAQELREDGIHAALLIVDATIESPKTAHLTSTGGPSLRGAQGETRSPAANALADQRLIAEAVEYLATQEPRAYSHELVLTPAGDRWVP